VSEPSLDRARLSGHEGHHSCALRKTGTEAESRDALLTAIAKARGWINDIRLGRIPHELDSRLFGARSSEGSILTRRDAPPDFLAFAIIHAMDAFVRGCNCLTDRCESDRSIRAAKCRHACDQRAPHRTPARAPL
jgi:hypothetical protein